MDVLKDWNLSGYWRECPCIFWPIVAVSVSAFTVQLNFTSRITRLKEHDRMDFHLCVHEYIGTVVTPRPMKT